jgi:Na+/proline symporter
MTPALYAILAYLAAQLALGIWISRRIATEADYLVAGRRLGYWLATFSIFATWFGAETIVGSAGQSYSEGVSFASAEPFGYGLCLILMGLIFAVPLWRRRLTTMADLYRQRFSPRVERLAVVILIPSSILWAAAQVRAFGTVLSIAAPTIDIVLGIAIAAAATILYTTFGGLLADAITDLVQGVLLAVGLIAVFVAVVAHVGGFASFASAIAESGRVRFDSLPQAGVLATIEEWAIPVCGSLVAAELVGRVIAVRSPEVARRSSLLAGGIYILLGMIPLSLGVIGVSLLPGLGDAEQLVPVLARDLLPTALFAVFAGGLISAILSTVDSTLLIASGLLSHNILVPALRLKDERQKVLAARLGVVAFGVIAYILALRAEGVFALVEQASAFGSAGVLVTVTFGLFSDRGGEMAAGATLLAGLGVYLAAVATGADYPFLMSLAASLAAYLVIATVEPAGRMPALASSMSAAASDRATQAKSDLLP